MTLARLIDGVLGRKKPATGLIGRWIKSTLESKYQFHPKEMTSRRAINFFVSDQLLRVLECYTFELAIIWRTRYKRSAPLLEDDIAYFHAYSSIPS
jgi:hypothetical protein